ncbi:MAG: PASTA domain-containing protein [Actinomycetia bacterium]|nr:PASTA domain-containing protein [Actinomycetes bacterium]
MNRMSDQIGRVLGGRYRLLAPVGLGASAMVFLAEDVQLHRRVAVKLLHEGLADDEKFLKRFRAEARSSAQLNHQNIVVVHDWGGDGADATPSSPYLVTEYLGGGSLRSLLDNTRLTVPQALVVGLQAARGLAHAHNRGFVHRDIKPANLLFGDDGRLRVADFGIARALAEAAWTEPNGAVVGTARYASPEQALGERVDGRGDVYSLALTLVEALTGAVPFSADTTIATLMARIDTDLEPDERWGALAGPLARAGRADRDQRLDSDGLVTALMAVADEVGPAEPLALEATSMEGGGAVPGEGDATVALTSVGPVVTLEGAAPPPAGTEPVLAPPDQESIPAEPPGWRRSWLVRIAGAVAAIALFAGGIFLVTQVADRWITGSDSPTTAPSLVGITLAEAQEVAAEKGWALEVERAPSDSVAEGSVMAQSPLEGEPLGPEGVIDITVSSGLPIVSVPNVRNVSLDGALTRIREGALRVGAVSEEFDESIGAGRVVSTSPTGAVQQGTDIDVMVSKGPAPRPVPEVVELSEADAVAAIERVQLVALVVAEASREVPEGVAIRTEPALGTEVARGSTVTVVVSSGLPFVTVPDVIGEPAAAAADILEAVGLVVTDTVGPPNTEVLFTDPAAGDTVREGTGIRIISATD